MNQAIIVFLCLTVFYGVAAAQSRPENAWWNNGWHFRAPVHVRNASPETENLPIKVCVDFSRLLAIIGKSGAFDEKSIRIISAYNNKELAFNWQKSERFDSVSNASGTIVWNQEKPGIMQDNLYYIYFDIGGNGSKESADVSYLPSDNLLKNPGFEEWNENKPLFWNGGGTYGIDKENKLFDGSSINIKSGGFFSQYVPESPKDALAASVYVKTIPRAGKNIEGEAIMHLVAFTVQKKFIENVRGISLRKTSSGWEKMEIICELPPATAYVSVHIFVNGKNISAWFDNVYLNKLNTEKVTQIELKDGSELVADTSGICFNAKTDKNYYELSDHLAWIKTDIPSSAEYGIKIDLLQAGKILRSRNVIANEKKNVPFDISGLQSGNYVFRIFVQDQRHKILSSYLCPFSKFSGPFDIE